MSIAQAVISGVIQGITEFFPVSSSGHLVLLHLIFNLDKPQVDFDIVLHLGTLAAVTVYFWPDIIRLFTVERKKAAFVALGTVPVVVIGFLIKDRVEEFFMMPALVCAMLIFTGAVLLLASAVRIIRAKRRYEAGLNTGNVLLIGLAQAVAIMPGISRSGMTIAGGMIAGLKLDEAFKFSFLLSLPAVAGASLLKLPHAAHNMSGHTIGIFLAGGVTAMVVGLAVLKLLSGLVRSNRLYIFGIYCIVVGIVGCVLFR